MGFFRMRKRSALVSGALALGGAFLMFASAGAVSAPASGLSAHSAAAAPARRRLQLFDYVWSEIRDKYYDSSFNGVDWEEVRTRFRPHVLAGDDAAFHDLLRAMIGELRDAHTRILTASQVRDRRENQSISAGAVLFEVEGQPVVFGVQPASPAAEAGLRPGMRVVAVNGIPIALALARARADVGPSSSERAALVLSYLKLIAGPADEMLRLQLDGGDGAPVDVALPRRALDASPRFEARRLPSGALYVRFDRFRKPVARQLRAALEANRDAPGLILDLRSNPGGDGDEGMRAIGPLLDRPILVARLATRTGRPPSALMGLIRMPLELMAGVAGRQLYAGPLVVLVNQGTGSTSEVIAASLQERGRARVIGTQSCGCALGVLRHRRLPDGGALAISEVGLVSGLGRRIEGEGVRPDVAVALRLADLREGRDPVLEAALGELAAMRR